MCFPNPCHYFMFVPHYGGVLLLVSTRTRENQATAMYRATPRCTPCKKQVYYAAAMAKPLVSKDVILNLAGFVDDEQYLFFASVSTAWKEAWGLRPKVTRAVTPYTTVPQLVQSFRGGLEQGEAVCEAATSLGRLDLLQCARSFGCPWPDAVYSIAAKGGHVDIMTWARANGCPFEKDTCHVAAGAGHLMALQWAHANRCPANEDTCYRAAVGGHMKLIWWLRSHGCPWDEKTCYGACLLYTSPSPRDQRGSRMPSSA